MYLSDRNYIYLGDHEIKNETPGKKIYPDKIIYLFVNQSRNSMANGIFLPQNMILKWAWSRFW